MNHLHLEDNANRHLGAILERQAEVLGDSVFLMQDERRVTFGEANRIVNSIAHGLRTLGVGAGDRVAFFAYNAIEVVFVALAANKLGAAWVPINTDYKGEWLRDTVEARAAKVVLADDDLLPRLKSALGDAPDQQVVLLGDAPGPQWTRPFATLLDNPSGNPDLSGIDYGDVSAILWTSGTTGKSKGVMQSHNVWICNAEDGQYSYDSRPGDVVYCALPMYNSASWCTCILRALVHGIACAIDPTFSVSRFWDRIRYYGATQTFTLGAMHIFLWQQPPMPDDRDNPLRAAGMVPMPADLIEPFRERFGIERLYQGFGQSEALTVLRRIDGPRSWKPGSLGEPCVGIEVRLLDDEGSEVAPDEIGEFALRPQALHLIFEGYFGEPVATRASYTGEWYRMGDLGRRDRDGDFYFVDRKKDAIRYKGRNISTMEVESVIRRHPEVVEVAAFGVPSTELASEHELKCNVVRKSGSTLTAPVLAAYVNEHAPHFFVPRYIEFVDALPYTPTKKVQKYLLRERGVTSETWDREAVGFVVAR
jgi:crotonobetaine/carnitine-CoA ligase